MIKQDTASATQRARQALAELFFDMLEGPTMEAFEDEALGLGHSLMAHAMASSLERFDALVCASLPDGFRAIVLQQF